MPSRKWWKMAEIYKRFAGEGWDFSPEAANEMFVYESKGGKPPQFNNGYLVGKQWMDLTITEYWIPDLREGITFFISDLRGDYPDWFLKRVLPKELLGNTD